MWLRHLRREGGTFVVISHSQCLWWRQSFRVSTHPEKKKINEGVCRRGSRSSRHILQVHTGQRCFQRAGSEDSAAKTQEEAGVNWGWRLWQEQEVVNPGRYLLKHEAGLFLYLYTACEPSQPLRIQIRDRSWPQCAIHDSGGRTLGPVPLGTCLSILWARRWPRTVPGLALARQNGVRSSKLW